MLWKTLNANIKSYQNDFDCSFKAVSDVEADEVTSPVMKNKKSDDNENEHDHSKDPRSCMVDGELYTIYYNYCRVEWEQYKCCFW